jgi:hypothetical protein
MWPGSFVDRLQRLGKACCLFFKTELTDVGTFQISCRSGNHSDAGLLMLKLMLIK